MTISGVNSRVDIAENTRLSSTKKLEFNDADTYINSSSDSNLDIVADGKISLQAATVTQNGLPGAAATKSSLIVQKTGFSDNVATDIVTFTVPNAGHAAGIRVFGQANFSGFNGHGSTVFEFIGAISRSSGNPTGMAFGTVSSKKAENVTPDITTITATAGSPSGGNSATQTITMKLTFDSNAGDASNTTIFVELLNSQGSGITMAAS
jgi:hypothetical protein